jgi:hypothetical protein
MYKKLGITHESDDSYRAWDKVRTEFLSVMKRVTTLNYENIVLISHEDKSKDITRRNGEKFTAIKPNIQDKIAYKVAGMVDLVARVIKNDDDRFMSFENNEIIFGGGRIPIDKKRIELSYSALDEVYREAAENINPKKSENIIPIDFKDNFMKENF